MPNPLGWRKHYGAPVLSAGVVLTFTHWLNFYLHAVPVSLFICAGAFSALLGGSMPPLHSLAVFEAFYTTKLSGLGMGGRLWAPLNPDHGASFHLTLPVR